jgi:hypothetical protein
MERNELKIEISNLAASNWVYSRIALNMKKYKCKSKNYLNDLHLSEIALSHMQK